MRGSENLADAFQNGLRILQHLVVPESKNPVSTPRKKFGTDEVGFLAVSVLSAIDLDDHFLFNATEINDVRSNG